MCLLVLAWETHPRYRLIVAANRDEFHERPAAPLGKWSALPEILGGRDLRAGGAWLALDRRRRFGVVTNFRDLQRSAADAPSRGALIPAYLAQDLGPAQYLAALETTAQAYAGFNLLVSDGGELWYARNRGPEFARRLPPGVYGLSNHFLDTPWPKLARVRRKFEDWLHGPGARETEPLLAMLADREPAGPATDGSDRIVDRDLQRALSAPFVLDPRYGTRCSTLVMLTFGGALRLYERRFGPDGRMTGETELTLDDTEWPGE
jgi:uncharacterized protein with NRDE domain